MKKTFRLFASFLAILLVLQVAPIVAFAESIGVGDIDGNGAVDSADYTAIKNGFLSSDIMGGNAQKLSDINGDGIVSSADVVSVIATVRGEIELPKHDYGDADGAICNICGYDRYGSETEVPDEPDEPTETPEVSKAPSEGLEYALNDDGESYSVTGIGSCTDTNIVIPSTYNGKPVTSIGDDAFFECDSFTSIDIPNSVTSIGRWAFVWCALKSITIPNSITSIGAEAFGECYSLTNVKIGNGLTSIGNSVFRGCCSLSSITIDKNNNIYHSAGNCIIETATKTLVVGCAASVIPTDGSVTSIGYGAFYGCDSLTSINIPDGVTSIGEYAFYWCFSLTSINIPDSVTSIGEYAFGMEIEDGLSGFVDSVYITDLEAWCNISFDGPTANPCCGGADIYLNGKKLAELVIPETVTSINNAFRCCTSLTSVTIPNSVTSIGEHAFYNCDSLTSITIPDSVTSIDAYAFEGCTSLTSVTIGNSVTSIGNYAFRYCSSLTSITIPQSVTSIGSYAFYYCTSLTSITIPDSVTSIDYDAFYNCTSLTSINYGGTKAQWNAISKGSSWNSYTGNYTVHCTDGDVSK